MNIYYVHIGFAQLFGKLVFGDFVRIAFLL